MPYKSRPIVTGPSWLAVVLLIIAVIAAIVLIVWGFVL
jgi:hypothetical protein